MRRHHPQQLNTIDVLHAIYGETLNNYIDGLPAKTRKPPPLVTICWIDAKSVGDTWSTSEEISNETAEPTISTGWIWHQTNEHITLATTINTNHIGGGILIPTACIHHIHTHNQQKPQ